MTRVIQHRDFNSEVLQDLSLPLSDSVSGAIITTLGNSVFTVTGKTLAVVTANGLFGVALGANGQLPPGTATAAGSQVVNVGGAKTGASATGLANTATAYTATITVDSVAIPVSIVGSTAQTYTTLLSGINTALGSAATATISGGNILVTSTTTGLNSSVSIVDTGATHLFSTLTNYVAINAATPGTAINVCTFNQRYVPIPAGTTQLTVLNPTSGSIYVSVSLF